MQRFNKNKLISRNSLSYHLLCYILLCSTTLALIITAVQLFWDYRQDVSLIENNIGQIESSFLTPIATSLWNLDTEQVSVQLDGIMNLPNMQFVQVNEMIGDQTRPLQALGVKQDVYDISRTFPLIYQDSQVGTLFVAASLEQVYIRLFEKSVVLLITQTIKTSIVSFCILIIIYYLIVRHINHIVNFTRNFNIEQIGTELTLQGRSKHRTDELDILATTFNQMQHRLHDELVARQHTAKQLQQERDFSTLLINSANMVICSIKSDFTISSINPAAITLTGYPLESLLEKSWLDMFVCEAQHDELAQSLLTPGSIAEQEIFMKNNQGHELTLQWTFIPYYESDILKYQIGFGYDITKLKQIEQEMALFNEQLEKKVDDRTHCLTEAKDRLTTAYDELKRTQQTLVESEKMASLGSLVAGVAHEINTPIGISVTASSYLEERVAGFKQHIDSKQLSRNYLTEFTKNIDESVQLLQSNLRRASELITSFKQVAVDQASEARYSFNLAENLQQVVVSFGHKLRKIPCEVEIQCDPKLTINSYPGRFAQIYSNLIANSINHAFDDWDKPKKISINIEQQGAELVIDYRDNGRGIPPEMLSKIFDPFVTSKRGKGGSGLGTHIIYNLVVQLLRGKISCVSEPEQGAQFLIRIPM